ILATQAARKIRLPQDHVVAENLDGPASFTSNDSIPENMMGLDIGPATLENYSHVLSQAATILWNGPMGLFEKATFNKGTFGIAKAIANSNAFNVVGGGDSVAAVNEAGLADKMS